MDKSMFLFRLRTCLDTPWKPSNENLGSHIPIVLTIDLITRIIGCEAKTLAPSAKSHAKAYIMLLKLVS